jgi:uncharacterized membrane protein YhaH (DUF805 family)
MANIFSGRIGRKHWILGLLFAWGVYFGFAFVAGMLSGILAVVMGLSISSLELMSEFIYLIIQLLAIPVLIFLWSLDIRRLHDLGYSGWVSLALFVPIVNLVLLVLFAVNAGKSEVNKYGEPPSVGRGLIDTLLNK